MATGTEELNFTFYLLLMNESKFKQLHVSSGCHVRNVGSVGPW